MKTLIEEIKKLSAEQIYYKNQRKTVKIKGDRKVEPWEAVLNHQCNRERLRLLYATLGVIRGKKFSEIENSYPEDTHPLNDHIKYILELVEIYNDEKAVHTSE